MRITASPEEFVTAWQRSSRIEEVMSITGLERGACFSRARMYRRKGVPLQHFAKPPVKWDELADLARRWSR